MHASIHEGARAGRGEFRICAHNDPQSVESTIREWRAKGGVGRIWAVVESLYSMDGDFAPLEELIAIADRHDSFLMVDEAHATGIYGQQGRRLTAPYDGRERLLVVALKMALGYWKNIGQPRARIVVMQNSYHGDTIGAMPVGDRGVFNATYRPLLFDVTSIPLPAKGRERETLNALVSVYRTEAPAAFIVEPLVLGAGGMLMYPSWG